MADSNTPVYSLIQPEIDGADGTWGISTNSNWLSVDNLLSGTSPLTALNVTGAINAGSLTVGDGTSTDLKLYKDGSNNCFIEQRGSGGLDVSGIYGKLSNELNQELISWDTDNAALSYRGASGAGLKLTTTAIGINVTGTVDLDNLTISSAQGTAGQVLKSTGSGIEWGSGGAGGEETLAQTLAFGNSTGANNINVDNAQKIVFGGPASPNLEIYETAAGTGLIVQNGSGDLVIKGQTGSLQNDSGLSLLQWGANDAALYWRGTDAGRRLITTEAGVDVTGGVQADYIDLTGGESTTTTGTIACKEIIFDDLSTLGTDSASISTEANGTTSTLRIRQADDANSDRILLQAGAEDVLIADSTGVQSSIMIEDRSTAIIDQNLIPYFGKRMINTATAATTYAIPQVSTSRRGKTVVICNPTNKTITLDADGGTDTVAQYVWILDGVTLMARNGDWQIKAGGVIELVQVGSDTAGGSETAPNYVIFGAGILAV